MKEQGWEMRIEWTIWMSCCKKSGRQSLSYKRSLMNWEGKEGEEKEETNKIIVFYVFLLTITGINFVNSILLILVLHKFIFLTIIDLFTIFSLNRKNRIQTLGPFFFTNFCKSDNNDSQFEKNSLKSFIWSV